MHDNNLKYFIYFLSFFSGFAIMTLEITASRIIAPSVGTSIFSWTSVIAIILLSLSLGNIIGGKLADLQMLSNNKILSYIFTFCGISVALIPIINKTTYIVLTSNISLTTTILIISSILFFIPSFLLGMIFPFLFKIAVNDLNEIGHISGKLSGLSAIGSIIGTITTGFFFIGYVGTTKTLTILSVLLFSFAILVNIPQKIYKLITFLLLIIIFSTSTYYISNKNFNKNIIFQKDSAYYNIRIGEDKDIAGGSKILFLDDNIHSIEPLSSDKLIAPYTNMDNNLIADLTENPLKILVIGGGSYSLPKYLKKNRPSASVDVLEIDAQVKSTAESFFKLDSHDIQTTIGDSRLFFSKNRKLYDVIVNDAYNATISVPWHLTTQEFIASVKNSMDDNGIYIADFAAIPNDKKLDFLKSYYKTVSSILPFTYILKTEITSNDTQNIILISFKELPNKKIIESLNAKYKDYLLDTSFISEKNYILLTDNFAPVERLMMPTINDYYKKYLYSFYLKFVF